MSAIRGGNAALRDPRWIAIFLVFGLAISILMVARSQVSGDQLNHLGRGWHLAVEGRLVPFGPPATKGGAQIGGLSGVLVGLPLMLWEDHRAPTAVVLLFHLAAYLLLDRVVREALGGEARFLFALLYWLSPWRLFFSGFLWNPNYVFLGGAAHLWTAWRLRSRPRFWISYLHVLALGLSIQIHAACLMLVIASILLWWRRYLRLEPAAVALAALTIAGSLAPWALAVAAQPGFLPGGGGVPGRGLLTVHPMVKGLVHWLRFPGLALSDTMICLDFTRLGGPGLDRLRPFLASFRGALLLPTLAVSAWCNWRLWRHRRRSWRAPIGEGAGSRAWLGGYIRWTLIASLATFGLSPTSTSHWYVLPVFHASVLPVVLAGGAVLRTSRAAAVRRASWAYCLIMLVLAPAIALGAPPYRCGSPRCKGNAYLMPPLRSDHPMFERLGIQRTCPLKVDDPNGWWPAALEEAGKPWTPSTRQEPYPKPPPSVER